VSIRLAHGIALHRVVPAAPQPGLGERAECAERETKGRCNQGGAFHVKVPFQYAAAKAATGALVGGAGGS
jgi:hypothetical protein